MLSVQSPLRSSNASDRLWRVLEIEAVHLPLVIEGPLDIRGILREYGPNEHDRPGDRRLSGHTGDPPELAKLQFEVGVPETFELGR